MATAAQALEFGRTVVQMERHGELQEFAAYVYPRVEQRFASSLVSDRNLQLSGDGGWEPTLRQVLRRRKPVAFLDSGIPGAMDRVARRAIAAGCPVLWDGNLCSVGIVGGVRREFDLDALAADYRDFTRLAGPDVGDQIEDELRRLGRRRFADCLTFIDVETDFTPAAYARCGLLLGYPPETTAAMIGQGLGIEGCWTGTFGAFGVAPDARARRIVARFLDGGTAPAETWLEPYGRR